MDETSVIINNYSPSWIKRIKEKLFRWIRLTNRPVVKVYAGYGGNGQLVVYGHVLRISPLPRKKYRQNIWTNTFSLIRLFMVRPIALARVQLEFNGQKVANTAERDGFFRLQWEPAKCRNRAGIK